MKGKYMSALRFALTLLLAATYLPTAALAASEDDYLALKIWCIERDKLAGEGKANQIPSRANYVHFHHYCAAMNAMNKANVTKGKEDRRYQLGLVMSESSYVLSHSAADHPLLPAVYTLRAQSLLSARKPADAERELLKALQMDPTQMEALVTLARLYSDTGRKDNAVKTVRAGLAIAPDNKSLRRLGLKLAMELPPIEGTAAEAAPTPPQPPSDKEAAPAGTPSPDSVVKSSDLATPETGIPTVETSIGSPTNPWCRFCPDTPAASPAATPSMPGVIPTAGR